MFIRINILLLHFSIFILQITSKNLLSYIIYVYNYYVIYVWIKTEIVRHFLLPLQHMVLSTTKAVLKWVIQFFLYFLVLSFITYVDSALFVFHDPYSTNCLTGLYFQNFFSLIDKVIVHFIIFHVFFIYDLYN